MRRPSFQDRLDLRERPKKKAVMYQRWEDLLFLHWELPQELLQASLPEGLWVDCFEGSAFLGVVPFWMKRIRPCGFPDLPWLSDFLELNVRSYVHDEAGRPGVWFHSLDASQPIAVWLARNWFHLPYHWSRMEAEASAGRYRYGCARRGSDQAEEAQFSWEAMGEEFEAQPGSLEFFLLERYLLFSEQRGKLFSGQVNHRPYPVRKVAGLDGSAAPIGWNGFPVPDEGPCHAVASAGVQVEVFGLEALSKL